MPVSVTFCLYIYLYVYYAVFYLYPTISKDFSKISFDTTWSDDKDLIDEQSDRAKAYGILFLFTSSSLIVSIVRTIATNPGNIPEHKEWDMSTDTSAGEESVQMMSARSDERHQDQGNSE